MYNGKHESIYLSVTWPPSLHMLRQIEEGYLSACATFEAALRIDHKHCYG
jgi:hypothetical protein